MEPISGRPIATRIVTPHIQFALALAAGLSLAPLADARAQHSGHHGHLSKRQHTVTAAPAASKVSAGRRSVEAGARHAGHGASAGDTPAVAEFKAAHATMMRGMEVPYTGDPDADFRIQMIPHHQGAIDMAQVAIRHAKDPWTRQLAEAVIVEQQREIAEMQAWLAKRGLRPPQTRQPLHLLSATSYRHLQAEPGTRGEAAGQSWAPGSGIPAPRR